MATKEYNKFSLNEIKKHLVSTSLGEDIHIFDTIDSTNKYAKTIAESGAKHGSVIISDMQTAGRGRLGREFFSPKGAGVYISVILRPKFDMDKILLFTSASAVAVCRALDKIVSIKSKIKWVNDIYLNNKKLCGILAESVCNTHNGGAEFIVIGVGINVANSAFPSAIQNIATSIEGETGKIIDRNLLVANIINEFEKIYLNIEHNNYDFMKEYRQRSCIIGKKVNALCGSTSREVFVEDIDDNGALIVKNENDSIERIASGEISIRF